MMITKLTTIKVPQTENENECFTSMELKNMTGLKPIYNIPELLKVVPIGRSKLYEEIKFNRLRPTKIGRRTLFMLNDVLTWLGGKGKAVKNQA